MASAFKPTQPGGSPGPKLHVAATKVAPVKKVPAQYQRYLDKMSEALNKNMEKNIFPHWRNHQSMKGNPLLLTPAQAGAP